jgi:hypothetical protein
MKTEARYIPKFLVAEKFAKCAPHVLSEYDIRNDHFHFKADDSFRMNRQNVDIDLDIKCQSFLHRDVQSQLSYENSNF